MNRKIPFSERELRVVDELPGFFGPGSPLRDTPVTPRENFNAALWEKHPFWIPMPGEQSMYIPDFYNNLLGRGGPAGTTDAFGIEWEWIAQAGGSIVRPGEPFLADANEWYDKIKIPDIEKWDWEGAAANAKFDARVSTQMSFVNGFCFERLISFMDFAPAALALIDEDQVKAVTDLFEATTDLGIKLVDKFCEYFPALDGFNVHDDWGSQKAPFFSQEVADTLFVPYIKALNDHIHAKGKYVTLHCCGHSEERISCFIKGGYDLWDPQTMNNTYKLFDEFGGQAGISVVPEQYDIASASEADQVKLGEAFAERFAVPGRVAAIGHYAMPYATPAFCEGVYKKSRQIYIK